MAEAQAYLASEGLADRTNFVAGDFFTGTKHQKFDKILCVLPLTIPHNISTVARIHCCLELECSLHHLPS